MSRESASSPLSAVLSVAMFLGFLLVSTQVLVHLHAVNVVTAVVADEARRAVSHGGCDGVPDHLRRRLGDWASQAQVGCLADGRVVRVWAEGESPARLVAAASDLAIERRVGFPVPR